MMKDLFLEIEAVPSKLLLAEECWQCSGSGKPMEESWADNAGLCGLCNGASMRITANGKAILALIALDARVKVIDDDHNDWLDQQQTIEDARNAGCP